MLRLSFLSVSFRRITFLCAAAFFLVCGAACVAAEIATKPTAEPLTQAQREAFQWFDNLGFPTLKDRQLVRIATGEWSQSGNNPPENRYVVAFLLKSESGSFTALALDLDTETFKPTPPKTPEHQHVGYETLDLKKEAATYVKSLRAMRDKNKDEPSWYFRHMWHFGPYMSEDAEIFVLARACQANALESQARAV